MKIKPEQLRKLMDTLRTRMLTIDHAMEHYEAILENNTAVATLGKDRMLQDFERLRSRNRIIRDNLRGTLSKLEEVLKQDEVVNGWKGEDRFLNG